jgi:hypothetical protein
MAIQGSRAVIPSMLHRRDPPPFDPITCKARTIIERAFHPLADRAQSPRATTTRRATSF